MKIGIEIKNSEELDCLVKQFDFKRARLDTKILENAIDKVYYCLLEENSGLTIEGGNNALYRDIATRLVQKYLMCDIDDKSFTRYENNKRYNFTRYLMQHSHSINYDADLESFINTIVNDYDFNHFDSTLSHRIHDAIFMTIYNYIYDGYIFSGDNESIIWELSFRLSKRFKQEAYLL